MSNYTPVTNFLSKDSLISGNPLKAVKGADFTTEFTAVQTALNSKFDGAVVFAPDGTAGQPSFGFTNNAGTGTYNAAGVLNFATGGTQRLSIATGGAVVINAPTSGVALSATGVGGNFTAAFTGAPGSAVHVGLIDGNTGNRPWELRVGQVGVGIFDIFDDTANASRLQISTTGAVSVPAPTSGSVALTITGNGASALNVTGVANQNTANFNGSATSGQSFGPQISAGTTSADRSLIVSSQAGASYLQVFGDGGVVIGTPTGADQGLGTINATGLFVNGVSVGAGSVTTGSFSAGTTGLTGATIACNYTKAGTSVTLRTAVPSTLASSTTGFTITGLPAAIQPTTAKYASCTNLALNNSAATPNVTALVSGSAITLGISGVAAAWTASGNKTLGDATNGATLVWDTN